MMEIGQELLLMRVMGPLSKKYADNWLTLAYYGALDQENKGACGFYATKEEAKILIEWIERREKGVIPRWSKEEPPKPPELKENPHLLKNANFLRGKITACCPFHEEKTPSFFIDIIEDRYKCFGCGRSGKASDL